MLSTMRAHARREGIPVLSSGSARFLTHIVRLAKPSRVLEIGTAIGYSAILMAKAHPDVHIKTFEKDEALADRARGYIREAGLFERIEVVCADARDIADNPFDVPFDFLFIDAGKAHYETFFEHLSPYLAEGGVLLADNARFMNLDKSEAPKRHHRLIERMTAFNERLERDRRFDAHVYDIDDGMLLAIKEDGDATLCDE